MKDDYTKISERLSNDITNVYKVGGLRLVLIFIGTFFLILTLFMEKDIMSYGLGGLGATMIVLVLIWFYYNDIHPAKTKNTSFKKETEMIDIIQTSAINLTQLANHLQMIAHKNAEEIANVINIVLENIEKLQTIPMIQSMPGLQWINNLPQNQYIVSTKETSDKIIKVTLEIKDIIDAVNKSLVSADIKPLSKYIESLEKLNDDLKNLLLK